MAEKIQCFGRLVDDKITGYFGDAKHKFHLEIRCKRSALPGTKLCGRCHDRPREGQRNHPTMLHGCVDELIPPWSHIFEGPWYRAKVADYGVPSEQDMAKGKKAQLESTVGIVVPSIEIPSAEPSPVESPKKKRASRQTSNTTTAVTPVVDPLAHAQSVPTMAIESNELILDDYEVIKIKVRRFEHEGTPYFLDSKKQKMYNVGADGRPTTYIGRWNPRNKTIFTEIPDSDFEEQ